MNTGTKRMIDTTWKENFIPQCTLSALNAIIVHESKLATEAVREAMWAKASMRELRVSELFAVQKTIHPMHLYDILLSSPKEPILVYLVQFNFVIADGSHRASAAIMKGQEMISAYVIKI